MSKRNWGNNTAIILVVGIGLFALIFVFCSYLIGEVNCREYSKSRDFAPTQAESKQENCETPEWWKISQRFVSAQDTLAQWLVAILTFASVIVSGVAVYLVRVSLDKTNEAIGLAKASNDISKNIGEAQLRAYLDIYDNQLKFNTKTGISTIKMVFKNSGQTPAYRVRLHYDAYVAPASDSGHISNMDDNRLHSYAVGPGSETFVQHQLAFYS